MQNNTYNDERGPDPAFSLTNWRFINAGGYSGSAIRQNRNTKHSRRMGGVKLNTALDRNTALIYTYGPYEDAVFICGYYLGYKCNNVKL